LVALAEVQSMVPELLLVELAVRLEREQLRGLEAPVAQPVVLEAQAALALLLVDQVLRVELE